MLFGRMNPPTKGHGENVEGAKSMAEKMGADHLVIASHSVDAAKNPLTPDVKLKHLKRAFPNTNIITSSKEAPTILHHAAAAHKQGYTHLTVVAGDDRVEEYKRLLNKYNGKEADPAGRPHPHGTFNFKKIDVRSTGERKKGVSGTDMRNFVAQGDFDSFHKNLSSHMQKNPGHAKELFKDVRKGMGLSEQTRFKAIFITGVPGSGKDLIIREAIFGHIEEYNVKTAFSILNDKHSLSMKSKNLKVEQIRSRLPVLINGTTNEEEQILRIKEELDELGYDSLMIFVNTDNEISKIRNNSHMRMMSESVRQERWDNGQRVANKFRNIFENFIEYDNSLNLNEATYFDLVQKEEQISDVFVSVAEFLESPAVSHDAQSWLLNNTKLKLENIFTKYKGNKNESTNKLAEEKARSKFGRASHGLRENNSPVTQLIRKQGKIDSVTDGDVASNSGYTFRTYEGRGQTGGQKVTIAPEPKETRFQQDNDKQKAKKKATNPAEAGKVLKAAGVSPEYDTRGSGTVYPMSGLGTVTYREQANDKYTSTAEVTRKSFSKFRKESIDSPSTEMGVTGGYHGPSNKEPMDTLNKIPTEPAKRKKK